MKKCCMNCKRVIKREHRYKTQNDLYVYDGECPIPEVDNFRNIIWDDSEDYCSKFEER